MSGKSGDKEKVSWGERGVTLKTVNKAYVTNYILAVLLIVLLSLLFPLLEIQFSFQPNTAAEIFGTAVVLGFLLFIGFLIEEPYVERMMRKYVITNEEVIKIEGILRKNRVAIPARSISDITVHKGIFGRIFDFGDIVVQGFKNKIKIKGIDEPNMVYKVIKNKVSIIGKGRVRPEGVEVKKTKKRKKGRKGRGKNIVRLPVIEMPEE